MTCIEWTSKSTCNAPPDPLPPPLPSTAASAIAVTATTAAATVPANSPMRPKTTAAAALPTLFSWLPF